MAKKRAKKATKKAKKAKTVKKAAPVRHPKTDNTTAVVALIVNLFIPGVGTIINGHTRTGVWQLVLYCGSILLGTIFTITIIGAIIGIPILVIGPTAAWIWALISSIQEFK